MKDYLDKKIVLVLNKFWQAIGTTTPINAFNRLAVRSAVALHVDGKDEMFPVSWDDWIALEVRKQDMGIRTPNRHIRIPQVIIATRFAQVPMKRPKFGKLALYRRQQGRCWYSQKKLPMEAMNIDHVLPRSRGGETSWKNCVLSDPTINHRKANRLPEEAGLKRGPKLNAPQPQPASQTIQNAHNVPDWKFFIKA
ncbi:MAG: HNH endonuclease [Verrucomicrobiota bacterium]